MANIIDNNKSYTNKDFNSIYEELLDLIPTLTTKWNPTNESDPGVVLTKLIAVLGDKLNYNIDKQVLECFPASVTQRKNARQIYNLIGYKMLWYQSAIVDIQFKLKTVLEEDTVIPKFTQLTNITNSISFLTLSDVKIYATDLTTYYSVQAIEGQYNDLIINGTNNIGIINLDENYRLYFSSLNIAENGIFICDANSGIYDWEQVDNVAAYPLGSKVYEFNVSNDEDICYLQFPTDIKQLISKRDAINIKYVTSQGFYGNISKNFILEKFSDSVNDIIRTNIIILQPVGTTNGSDPESVEDAYKNSRKEINTFKTLITRLDYENYIKSLQINKVNVVSNGVVTDRTNDFLNHTVICHALKDTKDTKIIETDLTAYDIVLYLLENGTTYENSFKVITDEVKKNAIEESMLDVKAVNLDFNLPEVTDGSKYLFKAVYTLKGQIVTAEKITSNEARELEEKIMSQLQIIYSSKNIQFGQSLNYGEMISNIQNIDSRIKAVILDLPTYTIQKVSQISEGYNSGINLDDDDYEELVTKMIARGNVQFYIFDESFDREFGQTDVEYKNDITKITTEAEITLAKDIPYTLRKNEIIQLYAPKYDLTKEYSGGCKVRLLSDNNPELIIDANTQYKLIAGVSLTVSYYNENSLWVEDTITADMNVSFICTNQLKVGDTVDLGLTGYLRLYSPTVITLPIGTRYICYLNNPILELEEGDNYLLSGAESLIYIDSLTGELIRLGSGVILQNNNEDTITLNSLTISDFELLDLTLFSTLSYELETIPQEIITLNEKCIVTYQETTGSISDPLIVDNEAKELEEGTKIHIQDASGVYDKDINLGAERYWIKSALQLIYIGEPIIILSGHSIILTHGAETTYNTEGDKIQFSENLIHEGGTKTLISSINTMKFEGNNEIRGEDGFITIEGDGQSHDLNYDFELNGNPKFLIPIYISGGAGEVTIESNDEVDIFDMSQHTSESPINEYANGDYILVIKTADLTKLTFTIPINKTVKVGKVYMVKGINTTEINSAQFSISGGESNGDNAYTIIDNLNKISPSSNFNYLYKVPEKDKILQPCLPTNFFEENHIYNRFTIPFMDIANSSIKINPFSIK